MTTSPPISPLDRLLKAIDQGQAKMKPRWQFVARGIAVGILGALIGVLVIFFVSLAIFTWHTTSSGILPQFGIRGWWLSIMEIPWWFLLVALTGSVALIVILERTTPWYRKPAILVIGGVIVLTIVIGTVVANAGFHDRFGEFAETHHVPFFDQTYSGLRIRGTDILTIGVVTATHGNRLTVVTPANEKLTVKLSDDTSLPLNWTPRTGDHIAVLGHRNGNTITADACRPLGQFQPIHWFQPGHYPQPEGFAPVPFGPLWST